MPTKSINNMVMKVFANKNCLNIKNKEGINNLKLHFIIYVCD